MIVNKRYWILIAFIAFLLFSGSVSGQISALGSSGTEMTNYPSFPQNDPIFFFCTAPGKNIAALSVMSNLEGEKNFNWERFNPATGIFEVFFSEISNSNQSSVINLEDGGYRVSIVSETGQQVFRAWVFNFWRTFEAMVGESTCDFFSLHSTFEQAQINYYDLSTGAPIGINIAPTFEWREGEKTVSRFASAFIYEPPTKDTEYRLTVSDRIGCIATATITYFSIVTKASFSANPMEGEAPLTVTFSNNSENGDTNGYEWFFFKDLDEIKRLSQGGSQPIDSIKFKAFDFSPVYTFENSGYYMVKLVSKKTSQFWTCTDTVYLENYIVVDTSYIAAPNVFTPNGDGTNDNFVVKFWSMKEVKISIFNRWGRTVHVYENKNVLGFENTWSVSAWDGLIGGRDASPGVYYYVVEGIGRDGKKRWKRGFVHLFRGKD